jgi:TonB-like protein
MDSWVLRFLVALVLLCGGSIVAGQDATHPKLSEKDFRSMAIERPMPAYPAESIIAKESGLTVAVVRTREDGAVSSVDVLEAPSGSIKAAVVAALSRWRFEVGKINGKPTGFMGKVSFYFVIRDGKAIVFNPDDAPYLGKWPLTQQGKKTGL